MRDISLEERGYLWLSLVDGMPVSKKYDMLEAVGGINELYLNFLEHTSEVISIAGKNNFARLSYFHQSEVLDGELARLDKHNVDFITIESDYYPPRLREIENPPLLLYYKGKVEVLREYDTLAIVGSRAVSRYGKDVTKLFAKDIARASIVIVSGLARGVDTIAHRTSLEYDNYTIAVVANGLDTCYPEENFELSQRIIEKGVIISEYPLGSAPHAYKFPERNRVISGIAKGVLVTEAGRRSGSLITLNLAVDQGKNVYIVPGPITSPSNQGTNDAIKTLQGAIVTESIDILKDYNLTIEEESQEEIELSDKERKLVEFIKGEDRHIDEICAYVEGDSVNQVLATLAKLELYGLIQRLPGNYYGK